MVEFLLDVALLIIFTCLLGLGMGIAVTAMLVIAGVLHG